MSSLIKGSMVVVMVLVAVSGPAVAQQSMMDDCAKMVSMITDEANRRFDATSYEAKMKAEQAVKLCKEGKKADAEKVAKEAAASLDLKM